MVSRKPITARWEIYKHPDRPTDVIGRTTIKPDAQYEQAFTLNNGRVRLILVSDDPAINQADAVHFARMLMSGQMIKKVVGMENVRT